MAAVQQQPKNYVQRIERPRDAALRKFHPRPSDMAVAIDDSGSTTGRLIQQELEYVGQALGAVKYYDRFSVMGGDASSLVMWSDRATLVPSGQSVKMQFGGTRPGQIFANHDTKQLVESRPIFVLCTDGQISQADVDALARNSSELLQQKALNIGILTQSTDPGRESAVSSVDVSVLAPLFVGQYLLLIQHDNMFHVAMTNSNEILHQLALPEGLPDLSTCRWGDLPRLPGSLDKFLASLSLTVSASWVCPPDCLWINTTEDAHFVVPWSDLPHVLQESNFEQFRAWDWSAIVQRLRLFPKDLERLREALAQLNGRMLAALNIIPVLSPAAQARADEINRLAILLTERKVTTTSADEAKIRSQYLKLRQANMDEEYEHRKQLAREQHDRRSFVAQLLADITEAQRAGWSLADASRGFGNRALRAGTVSPDSMEDLFQQFLALPDLPAVMVDCQICMDQGPAALLLIPGENNNDDFYLSDFAIDCPLACGFQASKKFANFHLCVGCAQYFLRRGTDMYQRPVLGVWPVIKGGESRPYPKPVFQYYHTLVKHAFLQSRDMGHGLLLMLAAVENLNRYSWGQDPVWLQLRTDLLMGLMHSLRVPLDFNPGSPVVSLMDAVRHVLTTPAVMALKPAAMKYLFLRLNSLFHWVDEATLHTLEQATLAAELVNKFRKLSQERLNDIYEQFLLATHEHPLGLPIRTSMHDTTPQALAGLPELQQAAILHDSLVNSQLTNREWTELVARILQGRHLFGKANFEATLYDLGRLDPRLQELIFAAPASAQSQPNVPPLLPTFFQADAKHAETTTPFYLNLGPFSVPDPLACDCGFKFYERLDIPLRELEVVVRRYRKAHFEQVYGSEYPSTQSHHFLLHASVAKVASEQVLNPGADLVTLVAAELKRTQGSKGDVFKADLGRKIQEALDSLREVWAQQPNWSMPPETLTPLPDMVVRSLAFKIFCALKVCGLCPRQTPFSLDYRAPARL